MSLMGIDIGTTGCKAVVFSRDAAQLCESYREYDFTSPQPGWAELDSHLVWDHVRQVIGETAGAASTMHGDPVTALAVTSLGEAMVPVSSDRRILGPSILNFDVRGSEFLAELPAFQDQHRLYAINGNNFANNYGLTKLLWIKRHQPELYGRCWKFLNWGSLVAYLLGAEPVIDFSLANRSLLFDIDREDWSTELLKASGIDREKLPAPVPSGRRIGTVQGALARELGLADDTAIVSGAHDQVANALGAGVVDTGQAMYGMGSYICIVPVFSGRRAPDSMLPFGFNTEHHCVPGKYASFLYQPGGVLVKWFRDTFAAAESKLAKAQGQEIYRALDAEMPADPTRIIALPHFTTIGPPDFTDDSCGLISGLYLNTTRGEILKGLIENITYSLLSNVRGLKGAGIELSGFTAVGGGSKSDVWIQLSADILGLPFSRPRIREAGSLGAAILAGIGTGVFADAQQGIDAMVHQERTFEPDAEKQRIYGALFQRYERLWPLIAGYQREIAKPIR